VLLRSWLHSPELLCQLSYRSTRCSARDSNPRPVDYESITGTVPARSREVRRGHEVRSGRGVEPQRRARSRNRSLQITEPLSARDIFLWEQACQGSNPDQRGWSSPCFRLHHRPLNRYARLESNQRPLPSQSSALSSELRASGRSLRQESNPHLGRTKGACLPLTLRRRSGDGRARTCSSSVQARCSSR
jgi:hypothetical protein